MKRNYQVIIGLLLLTLTLIPASLILTGCGGGNNSDTNKNKVIFNLRQEGKTLDPQLQSNEASSKLLAACMEGLVRQGQKNGEIVPGVAEKWETSEDGLTWTFHLRKDAKWSNGEPVSAYDFYYALKRAFEPMTASEAAYLFYCIKNSEEYTAGKIKDEKELGIKVLDDYTIQFTLKAPCPYFTELLAYPTAYPLNQKFYENVQDEYALEVDTLLYNGPWKMTKWIPGGKIIMNKNENYWNKNNIKIDELEFLIIDKYNTAANMFINNELDMTMIFGDQLPLFKKKDVRFECAGGLWYLQFNVHNEFFKNEKIRNAVNLAINREVLCNDIKKDGSLPAFALVPPGTAGGKDITFRERFGEKCFEENITEAEKLFQEGLEEIGHKGPVNIKLLLGISDQIRKDGQYIQEQLHKNLGINVALEPNTFQGRLQKMSQNDFDMVYAGWSPDYNDPMTFVNLFVTGTGNNYGDYSNLDYDKLVEFANSSPDNEKRMEAMNKAERILMKEMPIAPLYYSYRIWLVKPWLKDVAIRLSGVEVSFYWAYIAKETENKK